MNRFIIALMITLLFYIFLALSFIIIISFIPKSQHIINKEHKIKISLRDFHPNKALKKIRKKNYGRKKEFKQSLVVPPMPKGSQLKKIVKQKYIQPKIKTIKIAHKKVKRIYKVIKKTKNTKIINKKYSKKHLGLYNLLSTPTPNQLKNNNKEIIYHATSQIAQNIKKLYGETFGKLSAGEQKYILSNAQIMRRITQQILNRVGSVNIPNDLHVNTFNIIQFYLHPNGNMTDFKFLKKSNYYILDETTRETIEYAYSKYPLPKQTTLIRYRVNYLLQGQP